MKAPEKARLILLDSSVVLGFVLDQPNSRLTKMIADKDRYHLRYYILASVTDECQAHIRNAQGLLTATLKGVVGHRIQNERVRRGTPPGAPLSYYDLAAVEEAFVELFRTTGAGKPVAEYRWVEEWASSLMEEWLQGSRPGTVDEFMEEMSSILLDRSSRIQMRYDAYVGRHGGILGEWVDRKDCLADSVVLARLAQAYPPFPEADSVHLASAVTFAAQSNLSPLFVSLDYRDIVNRRREITKLGGPLCCDPLYVSLHMHHLL